MRIIRVGDSDDAILSRKAESVPSVTKDVRRLMVALRDTMRKQKALGLAAPQIGVGLRVIAIKDPAFEMANPVLKEVSIEMIAGMEGCLSLPGRVRVERYASVVVEGLDRRGKVLRLTLDGAASVAVQHEIEHLDGILITNYEKAEVSV